MTESEKERIKLRANWLNGISVATFAVGTLASAVRIVSDENVILRTSLILIALAVLCFGLSYALHLLGRAELKRIDQ